MSAIDCEIAKLSINVFLGVKIGYANTVARVCEQFPGADATEVLATVGADSRIGHAFMRHGGTAGGPCLFRDQVAFETVGGTASSSMVRQSDGEALDWVAQIVETAVAKSDGKFTYDVSVLGVAYKPGSSITLDSFGVRILNRLRPLFEVACHDPHAVVNIKRVDQVGRLAEAQDAAVVIVACAHSEYEGFEGRPGSTVIDIWGQCADADGVVRSGVGPVIK